MSDIYIEPQSHVRLETWDGKCAMIETSRGTEETHQIVFRLLQGTYQNATVYRRMLSDNSVSFAIGFELENMKYFLVVQRSKDASIKEEIQVRGINCEPSEIISDEKYLFRWGETTGSCRTLISVAEPTKYLSVSGNRITLSSHPQHTFRIL